MSMLDITKAELDKYNALAPSVNEYVQHIVNAIPFPTVPFQMKAVIAVAQLTNFAAQFRRNILLWDGDTEVPINAISFVITGSGGGKDSTVNKARKCFKSAYELLEETRKRQVIAEAIKAAEDAEEECPTEFSIYKAYLKPLPPIDITPSTGPGLIKHVNDIADLPLSSGFMYSGEFSDELASNIDMMENIKILSELYDLGVKNATYTKGVEHRAKEVSGQPVSALFVGSPGHILHDETTKKKFNVAFMSKLARRSWFCYTPNKIAEPDFMDQPDPLQALEDYEMQIEVDSKEAIVSYNARVMDVTRHQLPHAGEPITVGEDVFRLFKIYKRYNNDLADTFHNQDSTYTLIRRHLGWKALKLAGAFAVMDKSDSISEQNYVDAIRFCETLDKDMSRFEHDLNKSYHERFSDYIRTLVTSDGKTSVNIHDLKKRGFLSVVSKPKLQELATLSAGYDQNGLYTVESGGGGIQYEPIIKTDVIGISFKPIDISTLESANASGDAQAIRQAKHQISSTTAYGFEVADTTFAELGDLLASNYAYSSFRFRDGSRGKENIIGGTKWIVFDVDDSALTATEAHLMLNDLNHHIALSSNPDNQYKFRILLELDASVTLSPIAWKMFCSAIASDLAIKVDPLPQSQVFFSYAGRPVYSQLDAQSLEVRDYVMYALDKEANKESESRVTTAQAKTLLADPVNTFNYAYEAKNGEGSRSLIRAAYHAQKFGASREDTVNLIKDINEFWFDPMSDTRLELILQQITRMF